MQTLVKRRDVQGAEDASRLLLQHGTEASKSSVMGDSRLSAYREGLSYCVSPKEQGKPVLLLSRKDHRKVIPWECGQQRREKAKAAL